MTAVIVAVVLAAGRGERFGGEGPKPLAVLAGRTLLTWAVESAMNSRIGPVAVVVGSRADEIAATVASGVDVVMNPDWATGIGSSVAAAVAWASTLDAARVVIALADQPHIGAQAWRRVAETEGDLVAATYGGRRGHPVAIGQPLFAAACALHGDEGARVLMRDHDVVEVACDGTGDPVDVDTQDDLRRLGGPDAESVR